MKTICFFNSTFFWGGGEKLHYDYALAFYQKGYQVIVITAPNSELYKRLVNKKVKVYLLKNKNISFLNPFKIIGLVKILKKENVDTILFSSSKDFKFASIASKIAKVENIIYLRGLAVPIKASKINKILFKHVLTHIIANSYATKNTILAHIKDESIRRKTDVIYHGIETMQKTTFKKIKDDAIILGNAGRLTFQKGHDYLLQIAKLLKEKGLNFRLYIAGEGELKEKLMQQIIHLELTNEVYLLGFVENMEDFMSKIDIFLLTSRWEGFGYVLVEAMAKSKPIVAFNISSNPELINNQNGFLANYPDLEDFTNKTAQLISNSSLRVEMGKHGLVTYQKKFTLRERVDELENKISTQITY